ncbi:AmmeMemoRadiSam system radical SAM enzyme [Ruminiclostridium herbifermentans]|uniref:AmmeMemoRadiSam system radical SAM enzyme n=1 Tax=Ruminiclostridium herbifermentans TaxID=2488810 RepID=A0A4U7JNW8_9FIRM|nr:AmmeMemoRadiSam system radical SAM enzyme [Ruminiclostridium herbifermentans]QNU68206.1 AmmeMemoRadiSam system radical SAM enzyme [Ruminiclostridium herbifermentans]
MKKEALFYSIENEKVRCSLCPHNCLISAGHRGVCGVRECDEEEGKLKLFTINYGEITSISLDPITKKPLYHFQPNSNILSIGTFGCNFKCSFCQNYAISQYEAESRFIPALEMAHIALNQKNNIGLAFTYNEPTIWYEYVYDVAREIKKKNIYCKVVLVTNGYINNEPLNKLLPYVDAINVDLKGDDEFYKRLCAGSLEPVKNTIELAHSKGCHVEITTLLISGENNSNETLSKLVDFISTVDRDIVLHISRYFPNYKMDKEKTTLMDLKNAYKLSKDKLNFVYIGNVTKDEMAYITD